MKRIAPSLAPRSHPPPASRPPVPRGELIRRLRRRQVAVRLAILGSVVTVLGRGSAEAWRFRNLHRPYKPDTVDSSDEQSGQRKSHLARRRVAAARKELPENARTRGVSSRGDEKKAEFVSNSSYDGDPEAETQTL